MLTLFLAAATGLAAEGRAEATPIADTAVVHLGVTLRMVHSAELEAYRRAQQDPASPEYHHWLNPGEFGARFGQPEKVYAQVVAWLKGAGFEVTEYSNRTFIEARGTASDVRKLLNVSLVPVADQPLAHVPDHAPEIPAAFQPIILHISGLDTRVRFHHHLSRARAPAAGSPKAVVATRSP